MTNKEQAKELIYNSEYRDLHKNTIPVLQSLFSIELASMPDWYYPSKNEFPTDDDFYSGTVLCVYGGSPYYIWTYSSEGWIVNNSGDTIPLLDVECWTYLPKIKPINK